MDFIIFDLEATCWEGNAVGRQQEIIEIGALRMDPYGEVHETFQQFVKPAMQPRLSVYCKQLTGISQGDVDRAESFSRVFAQFREWLGPDTDNMLLCSWGAKDKELIMRDMRVHQMSNGWLPPFIDLKSQYHEIKGIRRKMGLKRVLDREGFDFEGSHHRALDDAANLCHLFRKYLDSWMF